MEQNSTTAEARNGKALFSGEAWFDPIEAGVRDRVRGFIEDLLEREYEGVVVVEGHHFMPGHLAPLLSGAGQACWLS